MTTYTLTQEQYDELHGTFANRDILRILKSLKPNSQEPSHYLYECNTVHSANRVKFLDADVSSMLYLYTHPAPISKEDMVKVLEALQGNRVVTWQEKDGAWSLSKEITPAPTLEAITIMQSAIEGMK